MIKYRSHRKFGVLVFAGLTGIFVCLLVINGHVNSQYVYKIHKQSETTNASDEHYIFAKGYRLWRDISLDYSASRTRFRPDHPIKGIALNLYINKRKNKTIKNSELNTLRNINNRRKTHLDCYHMIQLGKDYKFSNATWTSFRDAVKDRKNLVHETIDNCDMFKLNLGYITEPLSRLEANFSIAYSILMYKDFFQVEMLLRSIYRPQHIYCIHVDKKTDNFTRDMVVKMTSCFDNVFIVSPSHNVTWGTFSVLMAELTCIKELLARFKIWKYFINLTGQEYPMRTNYEIVKILSVLNNSNNVEGETKKPENRIAGAGPLPYNLTAVKGSTHVILSRDFAYYVIKDRRAQEVLEWSKNVYIPDEIFFSTLHYNKVLKAPGGYKGTHHSSVLYENPFIARFKNWLRSWPCYGYHVRLICIFGLGDLPLLATREELFANKFHFESPEALFCMEELIYNRTIEEYLGLLEFDVSYYASRDFVKNKF